MAPYAANGTFPNLNSKYQINNMDDAVLGYLITHLLRVNLTESKLFNSHWHGSELQKLPVEELPNQVTLSYSMKNKIWVNISQSSPSVKVAYSLKEDPTRFLTIHCYIFSRKL